MSSTATLFPDIAKQTGFTAAQVSTVAAFLDEGATIPFLARYRKEATFGLDEEQLRQIRDILQINRALIARKNTILASVSEQGELTDELKRDIEQCSDLKALEDLYLPYKPKRKTRADKAKEMGLEPLALLFWQQAITTGTPEEHALEFVNSEKGVEDTEHALSAAGDIVAEWINERVDVREMLRKQLREFGVFKAKKNPAVAGRTNFEDYYEFSCKVAHLKPYQILALNRGERENTLFCGVEVWEERVLEAIDDHIITNNHSIFTEYLQDAVEDSWKRLLFPSLERELRNELSEKADTHAIETFAKNLKNVLLQAPVAGKTVMGIDPAFRTGCKVAVVDDNGNYLEGTAIYPTPPHNKIEESEAVVAALAIKYKVDIIAIGNGTASRETEVFIAGCIQNNPAISNIKYIIVNEAGASVYSASAVAREEFPELDAAQRGNISIARRIQDPLAELVKIDPKSIGIGLYQHDVNQVALSSKLDDVVESCVNAVGVNLNTASVPLLQHVSGLSKRVAQAIVGYRKAIGKFKSRQQLKQIEGIGEFRFQQAAGFLRIPDAENILDNTAIHPESYPATEKLCSILGIKTKELINPGENIVQQLKHLDKKTTAGQLGIGIPTLELIIEQLQKPGRDPRESLPQPMLRSDVLSPDDLHEGMKLEGTVRNVVDFGAFVDIGLKNDGLLHISNMQKNKKVENPHEFLSVGDIISVTILAVDKERGRIGLQLE